MLFGNRQADSHSCNLSSTTDPRQPLGDGPPDETLLRMPFVTVPLPLRDYLLLTSYLENSTVISKPVPFSDNLIPRILHIAPSGKAMVGALMSIAIAWMFGASYCIAQGLINGNFENPESTTGGAPNAFGYWQGDWSQIVTAENSIVPFDDRMLKFIYTDSISSPIGGINSEVVQLVDVSPFSSLIASGGAIARVSADFNRVSGDSQTDSKFGIEVHAHSGSPSSWSFALTPLASKEVDFLSDGEVRTWEELQADLLVPVGTDYLAVSVKAEQNVFRDSSDPEFDGHYVDNVRLAIVPEPLTAALALVALAPLAMLRRCRFACPALALLLTVITATLSSAAEFIPLGTVPGYETSVAYGVSDDGAVVAGTSTSSNDYPRAFRWTDATGMEAIDVLGTDTSTFAGTHGQQPISADGSTIVAMSYSQDAFSGPGHNLKVFQDIKGQSVTGLGEQSYLARDISGDGAAITGVYDTFPETQGWRWTEATGLVPLGVAPLINWSKPTDITADGSIIVGFSGIEDEFDEPEQIFKWTEAGGMAGTGIYVAFHPGGQVALVSGDGAMIASSSSSISSPDNGEAFYWTQETGVVGLGWLPPASGNMEGVHSAARDMTPDGQLIVGWSGEPFSDTNIAPFVWTEGGAWKTFNKY